MSPGRSEKNFGYVINCNCVLTVVLVKPWAVHINTVMFDFGSKKIHHNMPFQATNDKTFGGREQGYRWALSLAGTHGCPLPPPVSKILAMCLRIVSLLCDTASRFTEFQCINISLIVYQ